MSNSFKTCDNRQNTCIHMNTHENMYWWSRTNYEPVWHVPTGSETVPCLLGVADKNYNNIITHSPFKVLLYSLITEPLIQYNSFSVLQCCHLQGILHIVWQRFQFWRQFKGEAGYLRSTDDSCNLISTSFDW